MRRLGRTSVDSTSKGQRAAPSITDCLLPVGRMGLSPEVDTANWHPWRPWRFVSPASWTGEIWVAMAGQVDMRGTKHGIALEDLVASTSGCS